MRVLRQKCLEKFVDVAYLTGVSKLNLLQKISLMAKSLLKLAKLPQVLVIERQQRNCR
jgi:hypothetical protein